MPPPFHIVCRDNRRLHLARAWAKLKDLHFISSKAENDTSHHSQQVNMGPTNSSHVPRKSNNMQREGFEGEFDLAQSTGGLPSHHKYVLP